MNYQVIAPPPSLKNYVRYFWALENKTDDVSQKTFTVMCNGIPGLIFQQDPEIFTGFAGERLPQLFVFGQAKKYGELSGAGSFRTIGVNFQPTALKSVFGLNANELTDQNICINNLANTSLTDQLLNSNSAQQQASSIFTFLQEQARRHDDENKKLNYAAGALQQGKKLPDVLRELNLSERSLERLFLTHIGITPIFYARICRFQTSIGLCGRVNFVRFRSSRTRSTTLTNLILSAILSFFRA